MKFGRKSITNRDRWNIEFVKDIHAIQTRIRTLTLDLTVSKTLVTIKLFRLCIYARRQNSDVSLQYTEEKLLLFVTFSKLKQEYIVDEHV